MKKLGLDRSTVTKRLEIIQKSLKKLYEMGELPPGIFVLDDNFAIAEHNLRYALEATFDICAHILSRQPGARTESYVKMAEEMGNRGFLPKEFAYGNFSEMARYRNRMTHFYTEIRPKELHDIIKNDLGDFEKFMNRIKELIQ